MTFTIEIKDEITKSITNLPESLISLCAYLRFNSKINNREISVFTENASVARWLYKLLKIHYNVNINLTIRTIKRFKERKIYILNVNNKTNIIKSDIDNTFTNIIDSSNEEREAFLKGVFLSCGSINDPKKNMYHLEFLIKNFKDAKLVNKILLNLDLKSKIIKRERQYMVYIKSSENISDFIKFIGANNALFYFEDIRIYKDYKNMVNRLNNCEQANMEKSLKSSELILNNIKYLENNNIELLLEDRTKEIITYKKKYPDTSMDELAKIVSMETNKSITKSGINHHFRKINKLVTKHKKD